MVRSLWHAYNLKEGPFFQEQLTADPSARYPIRLFVGREQEVQRLFVGIREKLLSSSRQTVQGMPGIGKSTLVQQVKHRVQELGVISHPERVDVGDADSTQTLMLRTLAYVYATILANAPNRTIADRKEMVTAQQLTVAFQARSGSATVGLAGLSVGGSARTDFVTPQSALPVIIPDLLRQLAHTARESLGAAGILVHLNNLETLTLEQAERAGRMIQSLRDSVLLNEGYHFIVVGTNEAISAAIGTTPQVRDVFSIPRPLGSLSLDEVLLLLRRRYEHLALDPKQEMITPVADDAVSDLHELFGGNLRGLLRALEEAAYTLVEFGGSGGRSMNREKIRFVLQGRFIDQIEADLDPPDPGYLRRMGEAGLSQGATQKELVHVWDVKQGTVSKVTQRLVRSGYLIEEEAPEDDTDARKCYRLAPEARLAYEPVPQDTRSTPSAGS